MDNIPSIFYWAIGVLVVMNFGTIISVLFGVFKVVWFVAKLESRLENVENKVHDDGPIMYDVNQAHQFIRDLREKI